LLEREEERVCDFPFLIRGRLSPTQNLWCSHFFFAFFYCFVSTAGIWVSRYTTLYFLAALCFLLTGFLDYCQEPGIVAAIFIMAGAFGVASATVSEKDVRLSEILNSVSVHLFCLEAISQYLYRHWLAEASVYLKYFVHFGDGCWIVGSFMDVVLSYIGMARDRYGVKTSKADVVSASLWLTCSLVYIIATIIQVSRLFREYRQSLQQRIQQREEKQQQRIQKLAVASSHHEMTPQQQQQQQQQQQPQHIPNRGRRYHQRQLQPSSGSAADSSSSVIIDDYTTAASIPRPPDRRDAIGESGHSTDGTIFA
jgi:hypothetical protein